MFTYLYASRSFLHIGNFTWVFSIFLKSVRSSIGEDLFIGKQYQIRMTEKVFISSLLFWINNSRLTAIFSHLLKDIVQLSPDLCCCCEVFCRSLYYSSVWFLAAYAIWFLSSKFWSFTAICLRHEFSLFILLVYKLFPTSIDDIFYQSWKIISHYLFTY